MSVCRKAPRRRKRLNLEEGVRSGALSRGVVSAALPAQASRQQYRLSRGRFPPVKMKTRRVARFDLRSAQRGPREYVPSCAPTCAALPLEQMVNLLEEYESAKGVPGSLESFDLRGTEGSKPPSSSGESCKPSVPRDRDRCLCPRGEYRASPPRYRGSWFINWQRRGRG